MTPQEFIRQYENAIVQGCADSGMFPSVKMAQMALETGWGKSVVGNNAFGIKATGASTPYWHGESVTTNTTEVINGKSGTYNLAFRKYSTIADSIADHSYLLQKNVRYAKIFSASTPEQQCLYLQQCGYATDPNYAKKLIAIMDNYHLRNLDLKKKA